MPTNDTTSIADISLCFIIPLLQRSWKGVYWYHRVRLSVCGQNRVRSVSSTIFIGFISYLHILSSNFRRCVAWNARFKIQKFEFWLGIQYDSMVWVIMRPRGYPQNAGVLVVLVSTQVSSTCLVHISSNTKSYIFSSTFLYIAIPSDAVFFFIRCCY